MFTWCWLYQNNLPYWCVHYLPEQPQNTAFYENLTVARLFFSIWFVISLWVYAQLCDEK